ncbi:MAG TPA: hypothetical protein VE422_51090 [Terriglobia bacterium]|nr:hypothetical protein [Terriglobia bacterium]
MTIPAMVDSRLISVTVEGYKARDPLSIVAAVLLLLTIGLIAGYIPSRRAVQVDPIQVLRYE